MAQATQIVVLAADPMQRAPRAICGNGVLEVDGVDGTPGTSDDEACDGGFQGACGCGEDQPRWLILRPSDAGDACCTPSCRLRDEADCSDRNADCCRNCTFNTDEVTRIARLGWGAGNSESQLKMRCAAREAEQRCG
jgi:hypothetical protein